MAIDDWPRLEDFCTPSDEDQIRIMRFHDLVASGMAEEDAYATLADEHNFSDEVIAPYHSPRAMTFNLRQVRTMRVARRFRHV
jgi:hypothetical protein